jgi:hypothetical protein
MDRLSLPLLTYEMGGELSESVIVYDRDSSLLVITVSQENDYSGDFISIGRVCIALGEKMDAVDIQIQFSEGETKKSPNLVMPEAEAAKVIFSESYSPAEDACGVEVHPDLSVLHIACADISSDEVVHLAVAQNVVFDVTSDHRLAGIWVNRIQQR